MEKLSKNCIKGDAVQSPNELYDIAIAKQCVYSKKYGMKPAAFIISMQFWRVLKMLNNKELYRVINLSKQTTNQ